MAEAFEDGDLRASLLGDPAVSGFTARVLVIGRDEHQAWSSRRGANLPAPLRQHGLWYGAIQAQDAPSHGLVKSFRHLLRDR